MDIQNIAVPFDREQGPPHLQVGTGRRLDAREQLFAVLMLSLTVMLSLSMGKLAASTTVGWILLLVTALIAAPFLPYAVAFIGMRFRTGPLARDSIALPLDPGGRWIFINLGPVRLLSFPVLSAIFAAGYSIGSALASNGDMNRLLASLGLAIAGAIVFEIVALLGLALPLKLLLVFIPFGTAVMFLAPLAFYLFILAGGTRNLSSRPELVEGFLHAADGLYRGPAVPVTSAILVLVILRQMRNLLISYRLSAQVIARENEYLSGDTFLAAVGRLVSVRSSADAAPVDLWSRLFRRNRSADMEPAFDLLGRNAELLHAQIELLTFQRISRGVTRQLAWRPLVALLPVAFLLVIFGVTQGAEVFWRSFPYVISLLGGLSIGGATATAFLSGDFAGNRFQGALQSAIAGRGDPKHQPWTWMPGASDQLFGPLSKYLFHISLYAMPTGAALAGLLSGLSLVFSGTGSRWPLPVALALGAAGSASVIFFYALRTPIRTLSMYRFADREEGVAAFMRTLVIWSAVIVLIAGTTAFSIWAIYWVAEVVGLGFLGIVALVYLAIPLILIVTAVVLIAFVAVERIAYRHGYRDLEGRAPVLGLVSSSAAVRAGRR